MTANQEVAQNRQYMVFDYLDSSTQPLTADEIAFGLGVHQTTVGHDLRALAAEGNAFVRQETDQERFIRFNRTAHGKNANLWSTSEFIPARTEREAVQGFVMRSAPPRNPAKRGTVDARVEAALAKRGTSKSFTTEQLASQAKVNRESARIRLNALVEVGAVEKLKRCRDHNRLFRIKSKRAVAKFFEERAGKSSAQQEIEFFTPPATPEVPAPAAPQNGLPVSAPGSFTDMVQQLRIQAQEAASALPDLLVREQQLETELLHVVRLIQDARDARDFLGQA